MNITEARSMLLEIAKNAYGSRKSEKTSGGRGNMGIQGNSIFKYDTHFWGTRTGDENEKLESCNRLREQLGEIVTSFLENGKIKKEDRNAIYKELGINKLR